MGGCALFVLGTRVILPPRSKYEDRLQLVFTFSAESMKAVNAAQHAKLPDVPAPKPLASETFSSASIKKTYGEDSFPRTDRGDEAITSYCSNLASLLRFRSPVSSIIKHHCMHRDMIAMIAHVGALSSHGRVHI